MAKYSDAVAWISMYDDDDLGDEATGYIVSICLVADLFGKTDSEVYADVLEDRAKAARRKVAVAS